VMVEAATDALVQHWAGTLAAAAEEHLNVA
jgi:hypothetical protein